MDLFFGVTDKCYEIFCFVFMYKNIILDHIGLEPNKINNQTFQSI